MVAGRLTYSVQIAVLSSEDRLRIACDHVELPDQRFRHFLYARMFEVLKNSAVYGRDARRLISKVLAELNELG